uniref:Multiple epidermal growth factor-like domains protein 10 isoform X2 n=1 Tax=Crassostrea virginica TaxID=6565 RepID=A0A8B8A4M2_CRAVI|nr:multiple epidermal growth factor-like domains protein 10 isoform X2 [Crassostrea virginica]
MTHILCKHICSKVFLVTCLMMLPRSVQSKPPKCEKNNGCCLGYTWNPSSQSCEKCTPGYTGLNCTIRCPYPSYGENCQRKCNCSKEDCDVSTGCRTVTTEISILHSCRPGYTGRNCRGACVYPYYGTECQGINNTTANFTSCSKTTLAKDYTRRPVTFEEHKFSILKQPPQWVRAFALQPEGWIFESQPRKT